MKRECFKRGDMSPEYYTSVVESVRNARTKWCDEHCDECPFTTKKSFCLLNTLEDDFKEYAEDKRKIIKKRYIDLTELESKNIITDIEMPDVDDILDQPKKLINSIRKFANYLENLEVEIYEVKDND